jgi:hypothetical protein
MGQDMPDGLKPEQSGLINAVKNRQMKQKAQKFTGEKTGHKNLTI